MRDNMKILPESETNEWFNGLTPEDQKRVKEKQQYREGTHQRAKLRLDPYAWWHTYNHVQKSDIHHVFKSEFKSKSRGRAKATKQKSKAPSNKEEVKENGS
jgi:hypothetical protein